MDPVIFTEVRGSKTTRSDLHVMAHSNNLFGPHQHLGSELVTPDEIFSGGNVENIKVLVCDGS